jgi:hypothetical protein
VTKKHEPVVIFFDDDHVGVPAEVCAACSDGAAGVWVPVSFCPEARTVMEEIDAGNLEP